MLREKVTVVSKVLSAPDVMVRFKISLFSIGIALGLLLLLSSIASAQSPSGDSKKFLNSLVGDWIGTCEQSTDGKVAENKYFHATIKEVDSNTYAGKFDYYRHDPKGPLHIGQSTIHIEIGPDGTASSKITGSGIVLVDKKPKNQKHELIEVLTCAADGLQGKGNGKLSVSGMQFGVGKNGKVQSATSSWSVSNGVLTIDQNIKVGFRALVFNKSFSLAAHFTARKGSDIASLMPRVYASPTGAGH